MDSLRLQIAIHPRSTTSPITRRIAQIRGRGRLLALAAAGDVRSQPIRGAGSLLGRMLIAPIGGIG